MPALIILVGGPGSGKTHVAEGFAERTGFVHVNSDGVRAKYFPAPQFTPEERVRVYAKIRTVVTRELQGGHSVVFDGNLLTNRDRFEALDYYETEAGAKVLFVALDVPRATAIQRAMARVSSADNLYNAMPLERAVSMHEQFEPIDSRLPHIIIADTDDLADASRRILTALQHLPARSATILP